MNFYIQYKSVYRNDYSDSGYFGYSNDMFVNLSSCDVAGYTMSGGSQFINILLNYTPEENRFYFVVYSHPKILGCELIKLDKTREDIELIKKGFVKINSFTDGHGYTYEDYYVEYLVYFK